MNTTPIISKTQKAHSDYTVLSKGAEKKRAHQKVSVILLNRGGKPFKVDLLNHLSLFDILEIISIETSKDIFDAPRIIKKNPKVKLLLTSEKTSPGEQINIGIKEALGSHVLVLWNDMTLLMNETQSGRVFKHICEEQTLCRTPILMNQSLNIIPSRIVPCFKVRGKFEVTILGNMKNKLKTLFPFDYCGIYHRETFILSGGFDNQIKSPYWQKMDFGIRSFLWGNPIEVYTGLKIKCLENRYKDDMTVNEDYLRFYFKNLGVRFNKDSCRLPLSQFFTVALKSKNTLKGSYQLYKEIFNWVSTNRFRFKMDMSKLADEWKNDEESQ